ncbi:urea ABC transporter permease subunit UrtB [Gynuella sp.]|uniref:urea ABC transporter permease subunit UrtB n=1 Tax=Gynuella sp. TaxID=2969146 RepID=UPI003D11F881
MFFCVLCICQAWPAWAQNQQTAVDRLLQQLTEARLKDMAPILEQLEVEGGEVLLPLFRTMLAGDLYYRKSDHRLVSVTPVNGANQYREMLTGRSIDSLSKQQIKKVRVNNTLRGQLRQIIARLQLNARQPDLRYSAVRSLLSELDRDTIATIRSLYPSEQDQQVKAIMTTAIALYNAESAQDDNDRVAAIGQLGNSLEADVRNALNRLAKDDTKPNVQIAAKRAVANIEQRVAWYGRLDQLFFGLSLGSVLLLAAIGLAITFGVMGVINMAHGEMIMLGAYTTYVVQLLMPNAIDYSLWVAVPAAFLVSGMTGILIERGIIRFLHGRPLETLLATFGVSLILQQLVRTVFSPLNRQVSTPSWMSGSIELNPVLSLTLNRLYIFVFALLVFALLLLILKKTSLGLNVRAVSQNRDMARAMGVHTERVDALTFGLGSGIAGIAGVALSQLTNVGPNLGQSYIIDSFMVVVFGGVGNLLGTLVAAFTLGIANKFLEPVTGAVLASILVLVFIILFIQKRPKGLFPQKGRAAE